MNVSFEGIFWISWPKNSKIRISESNIYLMVENTKVYIVRNLPRAALIGIFISTLVYVLTNIAYFVVLTPMEVIKSPAIAMVCLFYECIPLLVSFDSDFDPIFFSLKIMNWLKNWTNDWIYSQNNISFCHLIAIIDFRSSPIKFWV